LQLFSCGIFIIETLSSSECWCRAQGCQFVVTILKMLLHCGQCGTGEGCSRSVCIAANDQARDLHGFDEFICMIEAVLTSQEASKSIYIRHTLRVILTQGVHPSACQDLMISNQVPDILKCA